LKFSADGPFSINRAVGFFAAKLRNGPGPKAINLLNGALKFGNPRENPSFHGANGKTINSNVTIRKYTANLDHPPRQIQPPQRRPKRTPAFGPTIRVTKPKTPACD
jgi:hypothetical protein